MIAFDINACEYIPIDNKFGFIEYNDLKLYVTADLQWFCATRLCRSLKYDKICLDSIGNRWWTSTMKPKMEATWPDLYKYVGGKGTKSYKGIYIHISLLYIAGYLIDAERFQLWLTNEAWNDVNKAGTLYLLQPAKYIGTNIVKIGETKNFEIRLYGNDYGKGTMVLATVETNSRSIGEHHLKKLFDDNGAIKRNEIGNEYYEVTSLKEAKHIFKRIAERIPELLENDVNTYKNDEWIHGENNNDNE